jgi:hypothetical protein
MYPPPHMTHTYPPPPPGMAGNPCLILRAKSLPLQDPLVCCRKACHKAKRRVGV